MKIVLSLKSLEILKRFFVKWAHRAHQEVRMCDLKKSIERSQCGLCAYRYHYQYGEFTSHHTACKRRDCSNHLSHGNKTYFKKIYKNNNSKAQAFV